MTSGQRNVHVLLWLVLGPVALVGLALAVVWRPVQPVQEGELPGTSVNMLIDGTESPGREGDAEPSP